MTGGPGHTQHGLEHEALTHELWEPSHRWVWPPMNMGQWSVGKPCVPGLSQDVKGEGDGTRGKHQDDGV